MTIALGENNQQELSTSKRVVVFTCILFFCLLIWQSISASLSHHAYQESLMDSVTDSMLSDYQEYFNQLRLEIDLFQQIHKQAILPLYNQANKAEKSDYMPVYKALKSTIRHSSLFALIGEDGEGILKHITGDFLPACKEEVQSTVVHGTQEQLFLHRSKTSVHFDLLQPLLLSPNKKEYFFVAFKAEELQKLLIKYQLPYQQLFLMRTDNVGKIELSSEADNTTFDQMTMTAEQLTSFSYVKAIPKTRWQVAIRLDPKYSSMIFVMGLTKAIVIWALLTLFIYLFYRMQKSRLFKHALVEKELSYKDKHDKLTGLANREHFDFELSTLIQHKAQLTQSGEGVVFHIDIDQFQIINNRLGYAIGDKILFQLSVFLQEMLPEGATFSRLGNDEFAIILPDLAHSSAKGFADKVRQFIHSSSFDMIEQGLHLHACIGIVILDNVQLDVEQVLSSLHLSTALAKQKGRNRVQLYQSDDAQLQQHAAEMTILHDLALALKEQRLVLYRQEIRSTSAVKQPLHYEVLARLKDKKDNLVAPGVFIPAAEKYGLIKQLDRVVIALTLQEVAKNKDDYSYSINLSGASMTDKDTCYFIRQQFKQHSIDPRRICFEVTETSAITHLASAIKFMQQLTEMGCYFALDDFGSGHSSFTYLQKLPIQILKIDGAFVRDINSNAINRIFVENIQRTAQAMDIETVAEFVENQAIVDELDKISVNYLQGYHIHKPEFWC